MKFWFYETNYEVIYKNLNNLSLVTQENISVEHTPDNIIR